MILLVKHQADDKTMGERILDLAKELHSIRHKIIIADTTVTDVHLARVKLALDFERRPEIIFQAIMENWDQPRIVREMY